MIDYTEPRRVVEEAIDNNFSELPIIFENTENASDSDPHIEVETHDVDSEPLDMSMSVHLVTGMMIIGIFTEHGSGTENARKHASAISAVISTIENMAIESKEFASVGQVEGFNLYQHNLTVKFRYFYGQDDING